MSWLKKNSASFGKLLEPDPKSARHVVFISRSSRVKCCGFFAVTTYKLGYHVPP
jgi:hypothetical protein